jgi:transcriptional regulator with XRE-family HTH domain
MLVRMTDPDPFLLALGRALRRRRRELGVTHETVSLSSGRHPKYLGPIERGEHNVGVLTLRAYARALGMELSELIREAERLEGGPPGRSD